MQDQDPSLEESTSRWLTPYLLILDYAGEAYERQTLACSARSSTMEKKRFYSKTPGAATFVQPVQEEELVRRVHLPAEVGLRHSRVGGV